MCTPLVSNLEITATLWHRNTGKLKQNIHICIHIDTHGMSWLLAKPLPQAAIYNQSLAIVTSHKWSVKFWNFQLEEKLKEFGGWCHFFFFAFGCAKTPKRRKLLHRMMNPCVLQHWPCLRVLSSMLAFSSSEKPKKLRMQSWNGGTLNSVRNSSAPAWKCLNAWEWEKQDYFHTV